MELGGLWWTYILNSALPPQRHRLDTQPEHQDPVSHTAAEKGEKKKEKERKKERERERERKRKKEREKKEGKKNIK